MVAGGRWRWERVAIGEGSCLSMKGGGGRRRLSIGEKKGGDDWLTLIRSNWFSQLINIRLIGGLGLSLKGLAMGL